MGNKVHTETEYVGTGPDPIIFTRFYNSDPRVRAGSLGAKWRHSYDRELVVSGTSATLYRPDGSVVTFTESAGIWRPDAGYQAQLIVSGAGYEVTLPDGTVEAFDGQGLLQSITNIAGNRQTLTRDGNGRLIRVENDFGDSLDFAYEGLFYRDTIMNAGPWAYWRLGEGGGSVARDASGSGFDVSYVGAPIFKASGLVPSGYDHAIILDGASQLGELPDTGANVNAVTFELWLGAVFESGEQRVYDWQDNSGLFLFRVNYPSTGSVQALVQGDGSNRTVSAAIDLGAYHHIAVTQAEGGQLRLYIDGVLQSSAPVGAQFTGSGTARAIGKRRDQASRYLNAVLDEFAVYRRELSAQEIAEHYAAGINGPASMTVTGPGNRAWVYAYQAGDLVKVTYPDGSFRQYTYERVAQWDGMLTGVTDERGVQVATYSYDPDTGAANLTTHINNVGRREITYNEDGTRIVTDSLGRVKTYNATKSLGEILPAQITR